MFPESFARRAETIFGSVGKVWIDRLPDLVRSVCEAWQVASIQPVPDLSINWVGKGRLSDGRPVVLKLCPPNKEFGTELAALGQFAGRVSVQLIDSDKDRGALLLECLEPGEPLTDLIAANDSEATRVAADLMAGLWVPAPVAGGLPTVADWAAGLSKLRPHFGGTTGPFDERLVSLAERLFCAVTRQDRPQMLLHGDLHHGNILSASRLPWVIIDPKGVVGDPAYDAATFLMSLGADDGSLQLTDEMILNRAAILCSRLNIDRSALFAWAVARTVLSAWWCVEDHMADPMEVMSLASRVARLSGLIDDDDPPS